MNFYEYQKKLISRLAKRFHLERMRPVKAVEFDHERKAVRK